MQLLAKKTGRNYTARCPFHEEKTPSFSINPDKGVYKCFGCGVTGEASPPEYHEGNKYYFVISERGTL